MSVVIGILIRSAVGIVELSIVELVSVRMGHRLSMSVSFDCPSDETLN